MTACSDFLFPLSQIIPSRLVELARRHVEPTHQRRGFDHCSFRGRVLQSSVPRERPRSVFGVRALPSTDGRVYGYNFATRMVGSLLRDGEDRSAGRCAGALRTT
jgi:hypothetical protein